MSNPDHCPARIADARRQERDSISDETGTKEDGGVNRWNQRQRRTTDREKERQVTGARQSLDDAVGVQQTNNPGNSFFVLF